MLIHAWVVSSGEMGDGRRKMGKVDRRCGLGRAGQGVDGGKRRGDVAEGGEVRGPWAGLGGWEAGPV